MMNSLDRLMEIVVACVFLYVGSIKILGYKRSAAASGAGKVTGLLGLPYGCTVAVGVFEMVAALVLLMPVALVSQTILAPLAATGLALTTVAAWVCRARRHQPADPVIALFLLTMFVMVGYWR